VETNFSLQKQKAIINRIFIILFLLILAIPLAKMNLARDQVSEIDNRKLAELVDVQIGSGFRAKFQAYLADRIGFRTMMISAYQKICDVMFMKLVHPIYMYGEEGHIFFKGAYIDDYQHLNINKPYIESCGLYLETIYNYLKERNIKFLYFLIPDKKSVYGEYFPRSIKTNENE
jgi:hypothetical protein